MVVSVRTFHRFAAREGLTPTDPARDVRPSAIPRRLPKALPYEQVQALIDNAGDLDTPEGLRDRALVEFLYGTGTRISEAVGLDVDDVDLETLTVVVTGKGDKQRMLPIGEFAADALSAYLVRGRPALAAEGEGRSSALPELARPAAVAPERLCRAAGGRRIGRRSRQPSARTRCGTASPPTCSSEGPTSASSRSCSAMPR